MMTDLQEAVRTSREAINRERFAKLLAVSDELLADLARSRISDVARPMPGSEYAHVTPSGDALVYAFCRGCYLAIASYDDDTPEHWWHRHSWTDVCS